MDGLWQFSPWARYALPMKLTALTHAVRDELSEVQGLTGAVATSGACLAQGVFTEEYSDGRTCGQMGRWS